jgi:hypothetical protein
LEIICWEGQNIQRIEVVAPEEGEEENSFTNPVKLAYRI